MWHPVSCTARGSHSFTIDHMPREDFPASESWREKTTVKKKDKKKEESVGSEIGYQQGDRMGNRKFMYIIYSVSITEAYLSRTFAWWVSLHPGNRWSVSVQCLPYTKRTRKDGGGEKRWEIVEGSGNCKCKSRGHRKEWKSQHTDIMPENIGDLESRDAFWRRCKVLKKRRRRGWVIHKHNPHALLQDL